MLLEILTFISISGRAWYWSRIYQSEGANVPFAPFLLKDEVYLCIYILNFSTFLSMERIYLPSMVLNRESNSLKATTLPLRHSEWRWSIFLQICFILLDLFSNGKIIPTNIAGSNPPFANSSTRRHITTMILYLEFSYLVFHCKIPLAPFNQLNPVMSYLDPSVKATQGVAVLHDVLDASLQP